LDKICAIARALAIALAVVSAFVTIPYAAALIIVLGAVAGIIAAPEDRTRLFLITIVLFLGAKSLTAIPVAGADLAAIFAALGLGTFGASLTGIVLGIYGRLTADWAPKAAAQPAHA
jgi:hypothetical protein